MHGFVYNNGTFTTLNAPGANLTLPTAINDRGEVAGGYQDSSGTHGFVYENGTFTTLNAPGASATFATPSTTVARSPETTRTAVGCTASFTITVRSPR